MLVKCYEITNLIAKPPRDNKYMRSPIEFIATISTKISENARSAGLKRITIPLSEVLDLPDQTHINVIGVITQIGDLKEVDSSSAKNQNELLYIYIVNKTIIHHW